MIAAAISDRKGTARLPDIGGGASTSSLWHQAEVAPSAKSLEGELAPRVRHQSPSSNHEVEFQTIDSCVRAHKLDRVDMIKLDVEGAEIPALEGGSQTIGKSARLVLVIEFNPTAIRASGHSADQFFRVLRDLGFTEISAITSAGLLRRECAEFEQIIASLNDRQQADVNLLCRKGPRETPGAAA